MLALTEQAVTVLNEMDSSSPAPDGAGLRIAADPNNGDLTLRLAAAPQEGDEVISQSGALVFLDNQAASLLQDKLLDAQQLTDGRIQFMLAEQGMG